LLAATGREELAADRDRRNLVGGVRTGRLSEFHVPGDTAWAQTASGDPTRIAIDIK